ncbi:MAG TPA: carbon-nitrogen hydrolase family protein [Candidatus Dormibacteraeota bacterium]|jgi:predicted amidohydrolase
MSKVIERKSEVAVEEHRGRQAKKPGAVRVALVQCESDLGDETHDPREVNLKRAIAAIDRAATAEADLVVFGELYLQGYRTDEWLHKWASTIAPPDRHVSAVIEAAERHGLHVIMGMGTFGPGMPGDVYNTALLVGPQGIIGAYRKTHVAAFSYPGGVAKERCFYSPGKELPVFDTALGKIGIHICYDMSFPEVTRVQALKGADFLVNVTASAGGFEEYWAHGMFMRAAENVIWYMACSVVGMQGGDRLFGGSRVVDPGGKVVAQGKFDQEDFVIADIDLEQQRAARSTSHLFNVRQPEIYRTISEPTPNP